MADGSAQASPTTRGGPDPLIGRLINDRFKVVALVARGGMGKVYRAEQAPLGRTCALKVLNPKYAGDHDPEFHKRFFLEASIASKLTHPNTVTIFDYGRTDDDIYYMAMEYLEGRTLHRGIREEGSFSDERTAHVARQVCRSLREAHSLGVIHRDLKPANIFLVDHADEHDFVKVLDFGLVKNVENPGEDLTQAGLFMGSPKYMAPEQIKGDKVDGRTDIYALGIIMYEMLVGKVPFDRPNSVHIMMAHVNEPPPPMRSINPDIQISQSTEELIFKCLEKDPDLRYPSMEYLLNSLKTVGGGAMTATLSGRAQLGGLHGGHRLVRRGCYRQRPEPAHVPVAKWIVERVWTHHGPASDGFDGRRGVPRKEGLQRRSRHRHRGRARAGHRWCGVLCHPGQQHGCHATARDDRQRDRNRNGVHASRHGLRDRKRAANRERPTQVGRHQARVEPVRSIRKGQGRQRALRIHALRNQVRR